MLIRHTLITIILSLFLFGCSEDKSVNLPDPYMAVGDGVFVESNARRASEGIEEDNLLFNNNFKEGDKLYFSQKGAGTSGIPNFSNISNPLNPVYIYEYQENLAASWSSGYNFVKSTIDGNAATEFDWDNVIGVGPDGNTFKFFAFYFPYANNIRWKVEKDQTGGEEDIYSISNLLKSDICGAYHATSALYTRLRFRLFHLMTYLKVTIYVPVFNGTHNDYNDQSYSGFNDDALLGAYMMNAITDFTIDWSANRSSDTDAPLVQTSASSSKDNIKMYLHKVADENKTEVINVREFYSGQVDDIVGNSDEVRAYTFSVIFPTQTVEDNFLCFALKTPGGDTKYYYFSGSQILPTADSGYGLTQGTLQQLYLYLPRKTNQTILIGAKILPWDGAITDMTVNKQDQ